LKTAIRILILSLVLLLAAILPVSADENEESADAEPEGSTVEQLQEQLDELSQRLEEFERQRKKSEALTNALEWESDRDFFTLPNGWTIALHGEFRSRAMIEANTVNAYTNYAGERVYAYDPRSTLQNDYGWWDQRLQFRTLVNFGSTADLIAKIQVGDSVWGSRARVWGDDGEGKFDKVAIMFRELWVRMDLDPIPLYLEFGRMPWELGNRLIQGNEYDGARAYYRHKYFELGFGAFRQYEGENYEMDMATNDDEDTFVAWLDINGHPEQTLSFFGWLDDLKATAKPNTPDPLSPLWLLPAYDQDLYESQESQLWDVGVNYVGQYTDLTVNLEYNHQFGSLLAHPDRGAENIDFEGYGGIAKFDWRLFGEDYLVWTSGYGSGDDPATVDYEGFFAPDNDFGIKEEDMHEYRRRGYFSVYENLSPGAGVPGMLRENLGTGGIENTIFTNLGYDSNLQVNHHYWFSAGYIQAARKNPETDSAIIGWEVDARVDYLFSNNVIFSLYGGHLFIMGDYFRERAHDAAQLYFEWKLVW
jgi:hypothetical protein